jgi:probable HAF family extracellular repeat protein
MLSPSWRLVSMLVLSLLTATGCASVQQPVHATPAARFVIHDLSMVPNNVEDVGLGLNAMGDVAGWADDVSGVTRAIVWQGGKHITLGVLPGHDRSYAVALNRSGQVVGFAKVPGDLSFNHAFIAQRNRIQELGTLGGKYSTARAINEQGQVVGDSFTRAGERHGFVWQNGTMRDIAILEKGNTSIACDINSRGQIVGGANVEPNGKNHAFLWEKGGMRDLGLLPGGSFSFAQAINEQGLVAGWADSADEDIHACLWRNGVIQDLGTLGDSPSAAWSVNGQGQVVGSADDTHQHPHAFLWEKGHLLDLNSLIPAESGWLLCLASRINDRGQIVGQGWKDGKIHGFLLTPLPPSPATHGSDNSAPVLHALHSQAVSKPGQQGAASTDGDTNHSLINYSLINHSLINHPLTNRSLVMLDINQRPVRPLAAKDRLATVFIFLTHDCPIANAYAPEINRLVADYQRHRIVFDLVYVEDNLTIAMTQRHYKAHRFICEALLDPKHQLVKRLQASITPQAVVVTAAGKMFYSGRIDNRVEDYGKMLHQASIFDLRYALDALIAGKTTPVPSMTAIGCFIPDLL